MFLDWGSPPHERETLVAEGHGVKSGRVSISAAGASGISAKCPPALRRANCLPRFMRKVLLAHFTYP